MNNNNRPNNNNNIDTDDIGISFSNLFQILYRNIWIPIMSVFLLSSAGIFYHAYMVDEPVTETIVTAPFFEVNSSVVLLGGHANNNQMTLQHLIQNHDRHNAVVTTINNIGGPNAIPIPVDNRFNLTPDTLYTLEKVIGSGVRITAAQLRNGMVVSQIQHNNMVRLTIRATPEICRENLDTVSRNRIPESSETENADFLNAVLSVFIWSIHEHIHRPNSGLNHHNGFRAEDNVPGGGNPWREFAPRRADTNLPMIPATSREVTTYPESISFIIFVILGAALGAFGAVTKELMSDKVYDYETIEKKHNTKIIGMLPNYRK